jgi:spore coat polysaccharide biosynthesis protein SpsF
MTQFKTEQEQFWAGEFGEAYTDRNRGANLVEANAALFTRIFSRTGPLASVIELGANAGMNLRAIRQLQPAAELAGVEINAKAAAELEGLGGITVHRVSILDFAPKAQYEMALIKGVLIHINPDHLPAVYDVLHRSSGKYICLAEYYNPTPVEVRYRGEEKRLFKRDFAGEMLDRFPDLKLVDYGFVYHRDAFPQDDLTWFLMQKKG